MNPVPRMAKTFDNISESSATNYLFLFAQRTLALQNEPPTPPPLNALGLPCKAMSLLWACWLKEKTVVNEKPAGEAKQAGESPLEAGEALEAGEVAAAAAAGEETSETMEVRSDNASAMLKGTAARAAADKARLSTGSVSSEETETAPVVLKEAVAIETATVEAAAGTARVGAAMEEEEEEVGENNVATEKCWAIDNFHADDTSVEEGGVEEETEAAETPEVSEVPGAGKAAAEAAAETAAETETTSTPEVAEAAAEKEEKFTEKIEPLAKKIMDYILDHQDDAAQEDRWRTTMKRETMKCFRDQREASDNQRAAIDRQREEVQMVKAEVKAEVQKIEVEVQKIEVEVQKIEAGVQKIEAGLQKKVETEMLSMQQKFDEVHSKMVKMDEKMDQLVKNIASLLVVVSA
jgi:hypothetical protein